MAGNKGKSVNLPDLDANEWLFFRDRLREARYGALADAEGFPQMCFAFEALGARLREDSGSLEKYRPYLCALVARNLPIGFEDFATLFEAVKQARNYVMHTGAYARNAAVSAVQLSLLIEEAILSELEKKNDKPAMPVKARKTVADFMVRSPVTAEHWHTVGHIRRLMLLNSFSYLPIFWNDKWHLISDMAMAAMLQPLGNACRNLTAVKRIDAVLDEGLLKLSASNCIKADAAVNSLLLTREHPGLWLVVNATEGDGSKELVGVLSPFELM